MWWCNVIYLFIYLHLRVRLDLYAMKESRRSAGKWAFTTHQLVTWLLFKQCIYPSLVKLHSSVLFTFALYLLQHFWDFWVSWISCLSTMPVTASLPEAPQSSWFLDLRSVVRVSSALPEPLHLFLPVQFTCPVIVWRSYREASSALQNVIFLFLL